jgi:predicted transcriptional regulator
MPMGVVSDLDFRVELENLTPNNGDRKSLAIIQDIEKGRGQGNVEVPDGLRKVIGDESISNGRNSAVELANNFGISPSSVSAYSNGARSTATYDERPDLSVINQAKERIAKKARNRLVLALNSLTAEKIEASKARDISSVAKDMSAVVRNMEPEIPKVNGGNAGPTFIFYSPQMRSEKVFEVVHVKE